MSPTNFEKSRKDIHEKPLAVLKKAEADLETAYEFLNSTNTVPSTAKTSGTSSPTAHVAPDRAKTAPNMAHVADDHKNNGPNTAANAAPARSHMSQWDYVRTLGDVDTQFHHLMDKFGDAKTSLQELAPFSPEAENARANDEYDEELRRLLERRDAIANVKPFMVATVANAETWMYINGVLLYINGRKLRLLDLKRNLPSKEYVVQIPELLNAARLPAGDNDQQEFRILYYAHGVVSCLFTDTRPSPSSTLVVFRPKNNEVLTRSRLPTFNNIWVRNNKQYLYCGVHYQSGACTIRGYDLEARGWILGPIRDNHFGQLDVGLNTAFEIIDGYLYGLTSMLSAKQEYETYISHYYCFRFPVNRPEERLIERTEARNMWRRNHTEGSITDTTLRLFRCEDTGLPKIMEYRKEYLRRESTPTRTYYTTYVVFGTGEQGPRNADGTQTVSGGVSWWYEPLHGKLIEPTPAPHRDPDVVHTGDIGANVQMFTRSNSVIQAYNPGCHTFMDLVNDPPLNNVEQGQRLRLRGSSKGVKEGEVSTWPDGPSNGNSALSSQLHNIMNPPGHHGNLRGMWDDQSLVYSTGGSKAQRLIFISFDPVIRLIGVGPYQLRVAPSVSPDPRTFFPPPAVGAESTWLNTTLHHRLAQTLVDNPITGPTTPLPTRPNRSASQENMPTPSPVAPRPRAARLHVPMQGVQVTAAAAVAAAATAFRASRVRAIITARMQDNQHANGRWCKKEMATYRQSFLGSGFSFPR